MDQEVRRMLKEEILSYIKRRTMFEVLQALKRNGAEVGDDPAMQATLVANATKLGLVIVSTDTRGRADGDTEIIAELTITDTAANYRKVVQITVDEVLKYFGVSNESKEEQVDKELHQKAERTVRPRHQGQERKSSKQDTPGFKERKHVPAATADKGAKKTTKKRADGTKKSKRKEE